VFPNLKKALVGKGKRTSSVEGKGEERFACFRKTGLGRIADSTGRDEDLHRGWCLKKEGLSDMHHQGGGGGGGVIIDRQSHGGKMRTVVPCEGKSNQIQEVCQQPKGRKR